MSASKISHAIVTLIHFQKFQTFVNLKAWFCNKCFCEKFLFSINQVRELLLVETKVWII